MQYVIQIPVYCNVTRNMLYRDSHNCASLSEKGNGKVT
jgi:hypothetical protein